jgi:hypothetical protein
MSLKVVDQKIAMDALRVVLVHKENSEFAEIDYPESSQELINSAIKQYQDMEKSVKKLNALMAGYEGKKVYWWGAGSASVIYLNQIATDLIKKVNFEVVDGDSKKCGYYIPGTTLKIESCESLKDMEIDCLVIASSFATEIKETLVKNNTKAAKVILLQDLIA